MKSMTIKFGYKHIGNDELKIKTVTDITYNRALQQLKDEVGKDIIILDSKFIPPTTGRMTLY